MDITAVGTQVTNFPLDKGIAVGLVKTQNGLAASTIVILSIGFFVRPGKLSSKAWCVDKEFQTQIFGNCSITKASTNTGTDSNGITLLLFFSILCIVLGTIASHFLKYTPPTFNNGKLGKGGFRKIYFNYFFVLIVMGYCIFVSFQNVSEVCKLESEGVRS